MTNRATSARRAILVLSLAATSAGTLSISRLPSAKGALLRTSAGRPLRLGLVPSKPDAGNPCATMPCMYIANTGANSIVEFPITANGNVAPTRKLSGSDSGLFAPSGVAVDVKRVIYVANASVAGVTVYASGAHGNAAPIRTIVGKDTKLRDSVGVGLDAQRNIYIANRHPSPNGSVCVYAAGANGNVPPARRILGSRTAIHTPLAIAVDASGKSFVANYGGGPSNSGEITVYAAGAKGNAAPIQAIAGPNTGVFGPQGVAVDTSGDIYVANADSVTVFAPGASGNIAPIQTITGSNTGVNGPRGIALDVNRNIYVVNGDSSVLVFAAGSNGNVAPIQQIAGPNTTLGSPTGIAIR